MYRNRMRANVFGRGMEATAAALGIHAGHADPFWTVPVHGLRNNDGGTGSGGGGGAGGGTGSGGSGSGGTGSGSGGSGGGSGSGSSGGGTGSGGTGGQGGQNGGQGGNQGGENTPPANTPPAISPEELTKLRESAAELEKIRDGQRSDAEKAEHRATKAESRVAELEPMVDRLEVALEKGLSRSTAMRLQGKTRAELEADADAFVKEYGTTKGQAEKDTKDNQRTARRQQDGGVRGEGNEGKASVASGAELYANRRGGKKTAA